MTQCQEYSTIVIYRGKLSLVKQQDTLMGMVLIDMRAYMASDLRYCLPTHPLG